MGNCKVMTRTAARRTLRSLHIPKLGSSRRKKRKKAEEQQEQQQKHDLCTRKMLTDSAGAALDFSALLLPRAPPLDPAWLRHAHDAGLDDAPKPVPGGVVERQPVYAEECRALNARMIAPGARDNHLAQGISTRLFTVPSPIDGWPVRVLQYSLAGPSPAGRVEAAADSAGEGGGGGAGGGREATPDERAHTEDAAPGSVDENKTITVIFYIHGGGLQIGQADSEDLSCRRLLKDSGLPNPKLFSVGYRLMPQNPASTCVSDCEAALAAVRLLTGTGALADSNPTSPPQAPPPRLLLVGSSSGGQLAALLSQSALARGEPLAGVALRCPVTSDAFSGAAYVPPSLLQFHTSAWDKSFRTALGRGMFRRRPRDGLPAMPLEASPESVAGMPRTWIQLCTNDTLYSDGVCYAKLLLDAGGEVRVDVVRGWPHTFWLLYPWLERALAADLALLKGVRWLVGLES